MQLSNTLGAFGAGISCLAFSGVAIKFWLFPDESFREGYANVPVALAFTGFALTFAGLTLAYFSV